MRATASARSPAAVDALLARHNEILDIDRGDLRALVAEAQERSAARRLRAVRCADA